MNLLLEKPKIIPPLDAHFCPISLGNRIYEKAVQSSKDKTPLTISLEDQAGCVSGWQTEIFKLGSQHDAETNAYVERLVKFLLWQKGGWKLTLGGPKETADQIRAIYSKEGARAFDAAIMADVYERPFTVEWTKSQDLPASHDGAKPLGGRLDGCRIGFDLGASDYKIAAVKEGEAVFTAEIPWDPKVEADPEFHYRKINEGLKLAAAHLPRVDAIGGSAAGIYIENRPMVGSLFRAVPRDLFNQKIKPLFLNLQKEWGVPLEVANDGDVTALAGAMSLKDNAVLGIAMGSSEAGGFLDPQGRVTGWLNELAFTPVDYNPKAPKDEWSGDMGCGALYFSQQAVVRLAPAAGIELPKGHPAEQLKFVQELHAKGDSRAVKIFETIGVYLGYALAQYAVMYPCKHALILGRVTSGAGGDLILNEAKRVLMAEFPEIEARLQLHLPDEKSKRVGQAVAAASLPLLRKKGLSVG